MMQQQQSEERHVLVGESERIRHVRQMIEKVGRGNWPVLLLGETGAGKEVIARAVHSQHRGGPFVTIDCSAMVGPLVESELFGHVRGAFTGAMGPKSGLIEMADGGTAFFDEIGELPLELQSKLLRVLQEKEFRPVGSTQTRKSNFRIIAATNRDLAREVECGNFRRDLYYRLNVLPIRIPPLRERREDIPLLINHFLRREDLQHGLSPDTMEALVSYEWPGNVRELENSIHHMVAVNAGRQVQINDLPSAVQNHAAANCRTKFTVVTAPSTNRMPMASAAEPVYGGYGGGGIVTLLEMERHAIARALEFTRGDRNVAANLLGIGRTTLYRKLKEYGLIAV